jgi:ATP-binding cassette subfamily F protein 3
VFPGNYEDFRWRKEQREVSEVGKVSEVSAASVLSGSDGDGTDTHSTREGARATQVEKKRLNPIKLRQMQDRQRELEEAVSRAEAEIAQCEKGLETFVRAEETARLTELLQRRRSELEALVAEWEELSAALEGNAEKA